MRRRGLPYQIINVARGVKVSITGCDSVGEGSIPFEQPKKKFDNVMKQNEGKPNRLKKERALKEDKQNKKALKKIKSLQNIDKDDYEEYLEYYEE